MLIIKDSFLQQVPLTEGGEGTIYIYQGKILKVYKSVVDKKEKERKILALIKKDLPHTVVKPLEIAYNERNQFIGYLMNKVEGEELKRLSNKKFVNANKIMIEDIVCILEKIKTTLINLHKNNVFVGDLNDCNILFDKNNEIYFIDVDSWSVDDISCKVCMDTFKDPQLTGDKFSAKTDSYAFGILLFKSLTRIHPFGGTTTPDMSIIERMKNNVSLLGNHNVNIPRTIDGWGFISPILVKELREIFEGNKRYIVNESLTQFKNSLELCAVHGDYYFSKFDSCPICNSNANINEAPIKAASSNGIPFIKLFGDQSVYTLLSQHIFLSNNGKIVHINSKNEIDAERNILYYFSVNGNTSFSTNDSQINVIADSDQYIFNKQYKSRIIVRDKNLYYINTNNNLMELIVSKQGNSSRIISRVSSNCLFEVVNKEHYLNVNQYDGMKIISIDGYNYSVDTAYDIQEYGMHFDKVSKRWLFICEDSKGVFRTYVFEKNKLIYFNDTIKYTNELSGMCFDSNLIFKAGNKIIKAFSFEKNIYKDFGCDIVNEDSRLVRVGAKFVVVNDKEIFRVG